MEAAICNTAAFDETTRLASIHYNEPLIWFEASGFYHTINTETSLGLQAVVALCHGDGVVVNLWASTHSSRSLNGVDVGAGHVKALDLDLSTI